VRRDGAFGRETSGRRQSPAHWRFRLGRAEVGRSPQRAREQAYQALPNLAITFRDSISGSPGGIRADTYETARDLPLN
jgi:hypothetical protein